jgi:phosphatidate cytidylyltransferase
MNNGRIPSDRPAASELRLRVLSALVIGPLVLVATWLGGIAFAALITVGAVVMASEWWTIAIGRPGGRLRIVGLALVGIGVAVFGLADRMGCPAGTGAFVAIVAAGLAAALAEREARAAGLQDAVRWAPWGAFYAALSAISLIGLREGPAGPTVTIFLFAVVWSTDVAAYFVGRRIGGPKLWPRLSPKKTWSGAIGGLSAAAIAGAAVAAAAGAPRLLPVAVLSAVLSIASQAGDFFESGLKRRFGVKDSGRIIPGHGGLLDRVDGLVIAAILAFAISALRGGTAARAGLLSW